jgi:2-polyprenyl-3-methyl-5-hydroxy-6-metoxy-1,4-benzoquinol methylase
VETIGRYRSGKEKEKPEMTDSTPNQIHRASSGRTYKGVPVHAAPGLHESVIEKINASDVSGKKVLELGCGSGALTLRLSDNDFQVRAVDLTLDGFQPQAESLAMDLNTNFSETLGEREYDLIVAVELLEHLENPHHFLRQVASMMSSDTRLWLSFPNLHLYLSTWKFLADTSFISWNVQQYWETGHQTVLPGWLFEQHLKKAGLVMEEKFFVAPVDLKEAHPNPVKRLISRAVLALIRMVTPNVTQSQRLANCVLYKVRLAES